MGRMAYTEPQCLYKGDLYLYLYIQNMGQKYDNYLIRYLRYACFVISDIND